MPAFPTGPAIATPNDGAPAAGVRCVTVGIAGGLSAVLAPLIATRRVIEHSGYGWGASLHPDQFVARVYGGEPASTNMLARYARDHRLGWACQPEANYCQQTAAHCRHPRSTVVSYFTVRNFDLQPGTDLDVPCVTEAFIARPSAPIAARSGVYLAGNEEIQWQTVSGKITLWAPGRLGVEYHADVQPFFRTVTGRLFSLSQCLDVLGVRVDVYSTTALPIAFPPACDYSHRFLGGLSRMFLGDVKALRRPDTLAASIQSSAFTVGRHHGVNAVDALDASHTVAVNVSRAVDLSRRRAYASFPWYWRCRAHLLDWYTDLCDAAEDFGIKRWVAVALLRAAALFALYHLSWPLARSLVWLPGHVWRATGAAGLTARLCDRVCRAAPESLRAVLTPPAPVLDAPAQLDLIERLDARIVGFVARARAQRTAARAAFASTTGETHVPLFRNWVAFKRAWRALRRPATAAELDTRAALFGWHVPAAVDRAWRYAVATAETTWVYSTGLAGSLVGSNARRIFPVALEDGRIVSTAWPIMPQGAYTPPSFEADSI